MKRLPKLSAWLAIGLFIVSIPIAAFAHEVYVLNPDEFTRQWNTTSVQLLDVLQNPKDIMTCIVITLGILLLLTLTFFFLRSQRGKRFTAAFERYSKYGPLILRLVIGASFIFSAYYGSFLGPELSINSLPGAILIQTLMYTVGILFLWGLCIEIAALTGLLIITLGFAVYNIYLLTYISYVGVLLAFLCSKYEVPFVRVFYGIGLLFAAINIKLLHPAVALMVVEKYNLTQFHWLFPSDPLLVVLGAGLVEVALGLFIIFGFELRLVVLISLFYLTLSLLFFREALWPHLIMFGISFDLLVSKQHYSLDALLFPSLPKKKHP
jgi:hypothetical protein